MGNGAEACRENFAFHFNLPDSINLAVLMSGLSSLRGSQMVEMAPLRRSLKNSYSQVDKNKEEETEDALTTSASWVADSGRMTLLRQAGLEKQQRQSIRTAQTFEQLLEATLAGELHAAEHFEAYLREDTCPDTDSGERMVRENVFWPLFNLATEAADGGESICSLLCCAMERGAAPGVAMTLRGHAERSQQVGILLAQIGSDAVALAYNLAMTAGMDECVALAAPLLHSLVASAQSEDETSASTIVPHLNQAVRATLLICRAPQPPPDAAEIRQWCAEQAVAAKDGACVLALAKDVGVGWRRVRKQLLRVIPQHADTLKRIWRYGLTIQRWHEFEKELARK